MKTKRGTPNGRRMGLHWTYAEEAECKPAVHSSPASEGEVGANLRRLREGQHLSLRVLAEKSGLAINTLSLVENGKISPSVSTLQQLAVALKVPISSFFESSDTRQKIAHVKQLHRPRAVFEHGSLEDLRAGSVIEAVEPFVVTLAPGTQSGNQDIIHTGYEFMYCLEGRIQYTINRESYLLEPGDSLLFEAHLPHCWQNLGPGEARSLLVMFRTDEHDRPLERHFSERST